MNLRSALALAFGLALSSVSHAATELVIATIKGMTPSEFRRQASSRFGA